MLNKLPSVKESYEEKEEILAVKQTIKCKER